jgi:uncharacterized protein YqjF (DUF2071 family)
MAQWDPVDHRPWPLPETPWVLRQDWLRLGFLHWRVDPAALQRRLPRGVRVQLFGGRAYVGVGPFWMSGVRPRFCPPVPGISRFPEINVRTYVTDGEHAGVWFFSLDTPNRAAIWTGRTVFGVPYRAASITIDEQGDRTRYRSIRDGSLEFDATVEAGPEVIAPPGSLEHFLTERYCFHSVVAGMRIRAHVHHARWPLHEAGVTVECNGLLDGFGVAEPTRPDLAHCSPGVQVIGWPWERATAAEPAAEFSGVTA